MAGPYGTGLRRVAFVAALPLVTALAISGTSISAAAVTDHSKQPQVTGLALTWYPGTATGYPALARHDVHSAPKLFDALARDYANHRHVTAYGRTTTAENMQDFLVLWLPEWLNNVVAGTTSDTHGLDPSKPADLSKLLWVAHVAGYYGGVWLRMDVVDTDVLPVHFGLPFSNAGINTYYNNFVDKLRAAASNRNAQAVLAAARATLRSNLIIPPSGLDSATLVTQILPPADNLAAFGYDSTWLHDIVPPGLDAPTAAKPAVTNLFTHDSAKLLDAHYGIALTPYLARAEAAYRKVASSHGTVASRYQGVVNGGAGEMSLPLTQARFDLYGTGVYGIGVPLASSYRGLGQAQYNRVLTWAAYATMGNQANAMNAITAVATRNVAAARRELRATAIWAAYVGGYGWGNLNLSVTASQSLATLLPKFTRHREA
ncbi:MAG TPA: hypothetical protein VHW74_10930 [Mycobacteriales bacterium]|jgi:hypothetical protein|nr:hypothetical protein [Mycobacteriales bacterium]